MGTGTGHWYGRNPGFRPPSGEDVSLGTPGRRTSDSFRTLRSSVAGTDRARLGKTRRCFRRAPSCGQGTPSFPGNSEPEPAGKPLTTTVRSIVSETPWHSPLPHRGLLPTLGPLTSTSVCPHREACACRHRGTSCVPTLRGPLPAMGTHLSSPSPGQLCPLGELPELPTSRSISDTGDLMARRDST